MDSLSQSLNLLYACGFFFKLTVANSAGIPPALAGGNTPPRSRGVIIVGNLIPSTMHAAPSHQMIPEGERNV